MSTESGTNAVVIPIRSTISTREEAAARANEIRAGLDSIQALAREAFERRDWEVLGYESWGAYVSGEYGSHAKEARQEVMAWLRSTGLSTRAIAAETGMSQPTVSRHLSGDSLDESPDKQSVTDSSPKAISGRDGKIYPAPAPRPVPSLEPEPAPTPRPKTKTKAAKPSRRPRAKILSDDDIETIAQENLTRGEIVDRFGVGEHAAQLGRTRAVERQQERLRAEREEQEAPKANGRPKSWTGKSNDKRLRELSAEKRTDSAYLELIDVQYKLAQMCVVLEDIHVQDYGLRDVDLAKVTDLYDDLVSLGEWWERQILAVQGYLSSFKVQETIAKLRDTTGRTPDEAATALRLASRLEKKLENQVR
jgi:transposase